MRDKLQALAKKWRDKADEYSTPVEVALCLSVSLDIESILATEPPAVTVRAGWVCKGSTGLKLCAVYPRWYENAGAWGTDYAYQEHHADDIITDPWPDKTNGGPECCMEVK